MPQSTQQIFQSNPIKCRNDWSPEDNPQGGYAHGPGLCIAWQDGPRGRQPDGSLAPANGAFVEDALVAAFQRLQSFQESRFVHPLNAAAMDHIFKALECLNARSQERATRGVLGSHTS